MERSILDATLSEQIRNEELRKRTGDDVVTDVDGLIHTDAK